MGEEWSALQSHQRAVFEGKLGLVYILNVMVYLLFVLLHSGCSVCQRVCFFSGGILGLHGLMSIQNHSIMLQRGQQVTLSKGKQKSSKK